MCVYFYATTTSKLLSSQLTQFSSCLCSHSVGSHRLRPWSPWLSPLQRSIKSPRCFTCASEWLAINWVPISLCSGSFSLLGQLSESRETPVYFKGMSRIYRWRMSSVCGKGPSWNHSPGAFTDCNCPEAPKTRNHAFPVLGGRWDQAKSSVPKSCLELYSAHPPSLSDPGHTSHRVISLVYKKNLSFQQVLRISGVCMPRI